MNGLPAEVQAAIHAWHEGGWTPMGQMGTPADIGEAVALLCWEQAGWITDQTIYADGGASLIGTVFPLEIQTPVVRRAIKRRHRTDTSDATSAGPGLRTVHRKRKSNQ